MSDRQSDVSLALDAAELAIQEYYHGDHAWAEGWLLKAYEVNQEEMGYELVAAQAS